MVTALESANFFFDEETGNHILRISRVSEFIAYHFGCDEDFIKQIKLYSPLHDIGKVGVGKEILQKPARLTPAEFECIKKHVTVGYDIINRPGIDPMAKNIVLYHHEKWNGKGYVHGLSGAAIPLESRIVSLADVFDALVSKRVYKPAYSIPEAEQIIRSESGISFDPAVVEAFLAGMRSDTAFLLLYADAL
jgi:HD-GYP domain-containing protein (c-di-GMP phosphodiesterase class II)